MTDDPKYSNEDQNELKFEYLPRESKDADRRFTISVKNLLILIKDFYGADDAVVYWYNSYKKSFKLLASSEDSIIENHKERFEVGNDYISRVCLNKKSGITNINSEQDKKLINHFKQNFNIKSIIASPLMVDDEVLAVVLCESKTLNFFGTPNLYTLQVFSESITNYIKYYSLNEDFEYEDDILKMLASNKIKSIDELTDIIQNSFARFIDFETMAVLINEEGKYDICRFKSADGSVNPSLIEGKPVENGSLVMNSILNKKIVTYNFLQDGSKAFRYIKDEPISSFTNFCSIPFMLDGRCLGAVAFDTRLDVYKLQLRLSNVYKLLFPMFLYINVVGRGDNASKKFIDEDTQLYSREFFETRLSAEMNKCRLFNESSLYCVLISVDNIKSLTEMGINRAVIEKILVDELGEQFKGYDMLFKVEDNRYSFITDLNSEEKLFIEFEKIRKSISTKIFKKEGKEINFTVSFAVKKYADFTQAPEAYLSELESVLKLAKSEGGNMVKI